MLDLNMEAARRALAGEELQPSLVKSLNNYGLKPELLDESIVLGVAVETLNDPLLQEEILHLFTLASLLPLRYEVFPIEFLDDWLRKKDAAGRKFAAVMAAGTLLPNALTFTLELMKAVGLMRQSRAPLMGHLLNRKERLPYLHEQFFIVDLACWRESGSPEFGMPYIWRRTQIPALRMADECIHDDYTPLWMEASRGIPLEGKAGFGTQVLSSFAQGGHRILNLPVALRKEKMYAYPRDGRSEAFHRLKTMTAVNNERHSKDYTFVFNNEPLSTRDYNMCAEVLVTPCAGLKPIALLRAHQSKKVHFLERSPAAIRHYQALLRCRDFRAVLSCLSQTLRQQNQLPHEEYVEQQMEQALREGFGGQADEFMRCLRQVADVATFSEADYHQASEQIVALIESGPTAMFWHSNAWNCNVALYNQRRAGLRQN